MRTTRVQRIFEYLKEHGTANTAQLAYALGETTNSILFSIQHERNRNRWGIQKLGRDPNADGRFVLLWGVGTVGIAGEPMKRRKTVNRAAANKNSNRTPGLVLIPNGPYKTQWQQPAPNWSNV